MSMDDDDGPEAIYKGLGRVANAITPGNAAAGTDSYGGRVESLTEAVLSVSTSLSKIADAIDRCASVLEQCEFVAEPATPNTK